MKIFTKVFIFALLTCGSIQWTNAQSTCGSTVPELETEPTITIEVSTSITFPSFRTSSNLPDVEYAIQLIGLPATDSLGDKIITFSRENTINIDDLDLIEGDQFRVTPVAYDLAQVQDLIGSIFDGVFFSAPCCAIADLALPGLCENLALGGIAQGTDIVGLNDIITINRIFDNDPGLTFSIPGFAASVDQINISAGALPDECGGDRVPICYGGPLDETGTQLYEVIESLPVELAAFEAYAKQKHNLLKWTTATERNNAYFGIQRSANGQDFTEIGRVNGNGTSTNTNDYQFTDDEPLSSLNYYRLQQVDIDGKSSFSDIVGVVRADAETLEVVSFGPNPNNGEMEVTVLNEQNGNIDYVITDINGKALTQNRVIVTEGLNTFEVNITDFPAGVYFISIIRGELSTHLKFLKK